MAATGTLVVVLGAAGWLYVSLPRHGTEAFPVVEARAIYNVNDAGLGDLDGNGQLDRWTSNHSGAQFVALSDPADPARDGTSGAGLSQDTGLPGMEESGRDAPALRPVRVHMDDTTFIFEADTIEADISATMTLPWQARAEVMGGARATRSDCTHGLRCSRIAFTLTSGSAVHITPVPPRSDGFSSEIVFDPDTDLELIQVGEEARPAPGHTFTYASRDRHGMALADPDGAGGPQLFISRGGIRGRVAEVDPGAQDELFAWGDTGFVAAGLRGIDKAACPGRQTAWIDADDDGDLDLYQVCGRAGAPGDDLPNRLYLQDGVGRFTEEAAALGLGLRGAGTFRFLRLPAPDAPLMMLWVTRAAVALYTRDADGVFAETWTAPRDGGLTDPIVLRADGDGWLAGVLSAGGTVWLTVTAAGAALADAPAGLPRASADGAWVDADGDGRLDFFAVPQGLFLADGAGAYAGSDALDVSWAGIGGNVRIAWYDADDDGDLDLWLLKENGLALPRVARAVYNRLPGMVRGLAGTLLGRGAVRAHYWSSEIYENRLARGGRAVLVAGDGPPGNAQGIGRVLEVAISGGRIYRTMVGGSDMSRFSATLHRVFVPLGPDEEVLSVRLLME